MPPSFQLIAEAQDYVSRLFREKINPRFLFHNLEHTLYVVSASEEIAAAYPLSDEDKLALSLAAWFHDTGYAAQDVSDHEKESIKIAAGFLRQKNVPETIIQKTASCIEATRMPQSPKNLPEEIICDADLYHLGTDDFETKTRLLRKEQSGLLDLDISKKEWRKTNIAFLEKHRYFTDYCRKKLEPGKKRNLAVLKGNNKKNESLEKNKQQTENNPRADTAESIKKTTERTERGITTMFRIMSENHNNLSSMADSKANIMISVNSIIISIMVSVLLGRLAYYKNLTIPTIILITVCLGAIIFSILATRPKVSTGTFTEEDIKSKKVNLLFFGNFFNMRLEDYNWAMNEMMNDKEYLYGSMLKDIYYLGIVLARKYKYLRISYNIFMYGLIISMIAFGIALFFPGNAGTIP